MIGKLNKIGENWTVLYNAASQDNIKSPSVISNARNYKNLPLYPGPFPLPEGVFIDDVLVEGNEVHFEIVESDEQDRYANGEWARSYSTVKYAKLMFNHLVKDHDYLPGLLDQFDESGELDPNEWSALDLLAWLSLNKFKIVKK